MDAYITSTGSFLPGPARENYEIADILGTLEHEGPIREKILRTNGIRRRHYATDSDQESTMDVYDLGVCAARACLTKASGIRINQPIEERKDTNVIVQLTTEFPRYYLELLDSITNTQSVGSRRRNQRGNPLWSQNQVSKSQ